MESIVKRASLMSGADIQKLILAKGWTIRDVARYWDVSRQRLYQVFKQDAPALLWVCAAQGLPEASPDLLTLAKSRTKEKPGHQRPGSKPASTQITQAAGFSVGDILMASDYIGEIADEGEEGVITEIKRAGNYWSFLVRFDRGEDWFPETHLIDCMAPTGRQASEALHANA